MVFYFSIKVCRHSLFLFFSSFFRYFLLIFIVSCRFYIIIYLALSDSRLYTIHAWYKIIQHIFNLSLFSVCVVYLLLVFCRIVFIGSPMCWIFHFYFHCNHQQQHLTTKIILHSFKPSNNHFAPKHNIFFHEFYALFLYALRIFFLLHLSPHHSPPSPSPNRSPLLFCVFFWLTLVCRCHQASTFVCC